MVTNAKFGFEKISGADMSSRIDEMNRLRRIKQNETADQSMVCNSRVNTCEVQNSLHPIAAVSEAESSTVQSSLRDDTTAAEPEPTTVQNSLQEESITNEADRCAWTC